MRLALKNTLFLLAGYGTVLLVLGGVAVFQLLMLQANNQKETARLFAREVASALTEPSLDRLLQADRQARQNLRTLIEQLTRHSQVVTSVSVIDKNGRVVASDNVTLGVHLSTPDEFFGSSTRMRFTTFGAFPFYSGSYQLAVPLIARGARVGYLLIDLRSTEVGEMNRRMWNSLFLAALIGLLVITGLGFALHFQLARRGRTLARTLEAALRGESPRADPEVDEFSQAIAAAGRAGLEIHRAKSQSAEERGRLVTLGQVLNIGVVLMDADGRLEFASQRARQLFGCDGDDALAEALAKLGPSLEKGIRHSAPTGREGARIDDESPYRPGARLRLEVFPLVPGEDGDRLILVRDRATMKALETDLRLASQLRGLARLYLSVAHDVRAPLAAIVAHLELLGSSLRDDPAARPELDERRRGYLAVLDQEIQRLRRSLDSLLDRATLPRDELEELDVRDLVRDLEDLLRPQCARQKIALTTSVPDDPVRVLGVRDALKQALVNLGINALEAMPDGGRLSLAIDARDSQVVITVADSGPGIPSDLADKIFDLHFTTKSGGSGIGLHVARAVVESNGGQIQVSSEPGQGSTFRIGLPALAKGD